MPQSHANCPHAPRYTQIPRGLVASTMRLNSYVGFHMYWFYDFERFIFWYLISMLKKRVPFKRRCILCEFPMRLKKRLGPIVYFLTTPMMMPSCLAGHFATKALAYLALQSWTKVQGRTQTSHHSLGQDIGGISCEMSGLIARKVRNFSERKDLLLLLLVKVGQRLGRTYR